MQCMWGKQKASPQGPGVVCSIRLDSAADNMPAKINWTEKRLDNIVKMGVWLLPLPLCLCIDVKKNAQKEKLQALWGGSY